MNKVSVVMVSYHTGPVLLTSIASVLMQEGLERLVLVDNGNPPEVLTRLKQMALSDARLKIISGQGNIGFAAACNKGATLVSSEFMVLLNPDCVLPPKALATLAAEMNRMVGTAMAGPLIVHPNGVEQRGCRRALLTPKVALVEGLRLHRLGLKRFNLSDSALPSETHDVPAISGACMCIRKSDYDSVLGMDEGYFLHVEDLDLALRFARAGKRTICVPQVKVVHLLSTSGEVSSQFIEQHKAHGFVRYFEKHFAEGAMAALIPLLKAAVWARYGLRRVLRKTPRKNSELLNAARKFMILASVLATPKQQSFYTGKTVVVTGATSPAGLYVVKHLLAQGAAVLAISREEPLPFDYPLLKWLKTDLTRDDFSLGGFLADFAIHCAPQWFLPKILPALAASEVQAVVAIGSTSVFSKAASGSPYEQDIVAKHTRAEADIARISTEHAMRYTILRSTMIYGAGLDQNISGLARFIARFGTFFVYPPAMGRRQPVHVDDVAMAALSVLQYDTTRNKSYNISGGEILDYRMMLERIFITLGKPVNIKATSLLPLIFSLAGVVLRKPYITGDVAHRMNEDLVFFHDEAKADFGYAPRKFLSGGRSDLEGMIWHG